MVGPQELPNISAKISEESADDIGYIILYQDNHAINNNLLFQTILAAKQPTQQNCLEKLAQSVRPFRS